MLTEVFIKKKKQQQLFIEFSILILFSYSFIYTTSKGLEKMYDSFILYYQWYPLELFINEINALGNPRLTHRVVEW